MKKFKEFLSEEMLPYAQTEKGFVGVDNGPVRDNINIHLTAITAKPYATPYHAMEMVRKVLAPFSIFPPSVNFLDGESGHEIFEISQFGDKMGMTNNGEVVHKMASPYYVYFEYAMNDTGAFDIFCEIVTENELEEIIADVEDEMDGEDTTTGDMADAEDSYDAYKAKNQVNEEKKDDLPFDNPTEKPSTPYKNPKSKAKQLARMAMKKAMTSDKAFSKPWEQTGKPLDGDKLADQHRAAAAHYAKNMQDMKEDHDSVSKQNAENAKAISKSFRKKDKPEAKAWRQATKKLYNKAVTGLPQKKVKGLGGLDESEEHKKMSYDDFIKSRNNLAKRWLRADRAEKKLEEAQINEGRPSQRHPLEGHEYHRKSDAELTYIGKDAHKAAEAMKGHNSKAEAKYLDQANDAATVRHFRKRNGMPNWYKKKYGHDKA